MTRRPRGAFGLGGGAFGTTNTTTNLRLDPNYETYINRWDVPIAIYEEFRNLDPLENKKPDLSIWTDSKGNTTPIKEIQIDHLQNIYAKMIRQNDWRVEYRPIIREEVRRRRQEEQQKELTTMGNTTAAQKAKSLHDNEYAMIEQIQLIETLSKGLSVVYDNYVDYETVLEEESLDDLFGFLHDKKQVASLLSIIDSWREKNNKEILDRDKQNGNSSKD